MPTRATSISRSQGSQEQGPPESASLTVFDDYVGTGSTSTGASAKVLTSASLDDVLGFYDQLAIQAIVDDTTAGTAPAALTVQIAHSADGVNYVFKNASPEVSTPTQLNIGATTYMSFGYDDGTYPSFGLVRLAIVLTAAVGPVRARVRVIVTGNNLNEQAFSRIAANGLSAQAGAARSYVIQYGPGQKIAASAISELVQLIRDLPNISVAQIHQKDQDAHDTLVHPHDHSKDELNNAQLFLNWEPILLRKMNGAFNGTTIVVPKGHMIAFLADGHYLLFNEGLLLWRSTLPSKALFPETGALANDSVGVGVKERIVHGKSGSGRSSGGSISVGGVAGSGYNLGSLSNEPPRRADVVTGKGR
jgi:hypothetical protein